MIISGIYSLSELKEAIAKNPEEWRPMVFTNGCFDLLHVGHLRYLKVAKSWGRSLVVGLNSDRSIQTIKPNSLGQPLRPIVPEMQRAELLAALKPVDAVTIFDQNTASELIEALKPDIYVKGGDYSLENLPEASIVKAYGGRIELVKIEIPTSTTSIIYHILQAAK